MGKKIFKRCKNGSKTGILTRHACKVSMGPKMQRRPPATRTCGGQPPPTTKTTNAVGGWSSASLSVATTMTSYLTRPQRQWPCRAYGLGYRQWQWLVAGVGRARFGRVGGGDCDGGSDDDGDDSSCGDSGDGCGDRVGGSDDGGAAGRRRAGTGACGVGNTTAIAAGRHTSSCPWPLRLVRAVTMVLSARRRGRPAGQPPIWHGRRQSTIYGDVVAVVVAAITSGGGGGWPTATAALSSAGSLLPGVVQSAGLVGRIKNRTKNHWYDTRINMPSVGASNASNVYNNIIIIRTCLTAKDDFGRDISAEPGARIHTYATYLYAVQSATRAPCALRTVSEKERETTTRARERPRALERPKRRCRGARVE